MFFKKYKKGERKIMKMYTEPHGLNDYLNQEFECDCGNTHKAPLKKVVVCKDAIYQLPEIIKELGISEGDKFDVVKKDGGIFLCPVIVYPKDKLLKIAKLIKDSEIEISSQESFDTVEDMFADMGINVDNV